VAQLRVDQILAEDVQYPLGAVNGSAVIGEARRAHLLAQLRSQPEHRDQVAGMILTPLHGGGSLDGAAIMGRDTEARRAAGLSISSDRTAALA
jgi:hypothetical protein